MSANPHANGGLLLRDLRLPDFEAYAVDVPKPGAVDAEACRVQGDVHPRRDEAQRRAAQLPRLQPRRDRLQPLGRGLRSHRPLLDRPDPAHRRPRVARRPRDGDAQRAPVPGLAGRLPAHRPPRLLLLLRGVHPHHRLDVQPARQVAQGHAAASPGGGRSRR